jgi:hypothetical protein
MNVSQVGNLMIGSYWKPTEEILGYLEGKEKLVLMGCGGCATVFHTGGEPELGEMARVLSNHGKIMLATIAPPFGEFTCYAPHSKPHLDKYREELERRMPAWPFCWHLSADPVSQGIAEWSLRGGKKR